MAVVLMIIGTFTGLAEGVIIKSYNSRHSQGGLVFTAIVSLFSMLFFTITDQNGFVFVPEVWWYGILSGVLYCVASFLTYVALSCGSFAMTMLIMSYTMLFPIVYGIVFLQEHATAFTCVGLLVLMVSVYLVQEKDGDGGGKFSVKWLVAIAISFAANGFLGILQRMQQIRVDNAYTNEYMMITLGVSAAVLLVAGLAQNRKSFGRILRHGGFFAAGAGLSNGATNMLTMAVNALIPLSIASPMRAGFRIVISVLVSVICFKERFSKKQIVGVAFGTLALVLLNL